MIPWNYNAFPEICEASTRGILLACNIFGPRRIAINNLGLVSIQFSDESANLSLTSSVLPIQQLVGSKYEHVRSRATLETLNPRGPSAIPWLWRGARKLEACLSWYGGGGGGRRGGGRGGGGGGGGDAEQEEVEVVMVMGTCMNCVLRH